MTKLENAVKNWLTFPKQDPCFSLSLNEYLEKKGVKATEKEMENAVDSATQELNKGKTK